MSTNRKKEAKKSPKELNYFYVDESVKHYEFADFVRISTYPHGIILYFGQFQPEEKKFGIFRSITLPYDVAGSLSEIISRQIDKLAQEGLLVKEKIEQRSQ